MKTIIKLFPAPHVEIRIHVSDEMKRDYQECKMQCADEKDCGKCSWWGVDVGDEGACDLPIMQEFRNTGGDHDEN